MVHLVPRLIAIAVAVSLLVLIERLFALRRDQRVLRPGWRTDVAHAFLSHALAQLGIALAVGLVFAAIGDLASDALQARVQAQPRWLQFLEAIGVTELVGYAVHRAAHKLPVLWRFHRVHHSSEQLDWLASFRIHPIDLVISRATQFGPLFLLGFSQATFGAYLGFITLWALLIHSNVRFRFGPLRFLFTTPQFHHWHHSNDAVARDKNFAGQLPVIDALLGTLHLPDAWPDSYGVDDKVPPTYLAQIAEPFGTLSAAARRPR
ncbi:MAG TPA: sterol desaturase family protein [Myxococcota bacterium]